MDISTLFTTFAKIIAVVSMAVIAFSALYFIYRFFGILRGEKKSPRATAATYTGLVVSVLASLMAGVAFHEYDKSQQHRKHELAELRGISPDLDKKINEAQVSRISFNHTVRLKKQAYEICEHLLEDSKPGIPKPCKKINDPLWEVYEGKEYSLSQSKPKYRQ